jgi:hypothetical protein
VGHYILDFEAARAIAADDGRDIARQLQSPTQKAIDAENAPAKISTQRKNLLRYGIKRAVL